MTTEQLSRRERQRQATYDEIVDLARRLLRADQEVSIRAVAGAMGLTPPALYRYVDSAAALDELVTQHILVDVVATMTRARDRYDTTDPAAQIVASATAFRDWALGNPAEFRMVFASPPAPDRMETPHHRKHPLPPGYDDCQAEPLFIDYFGEIFGRLWFARRFPVPPRAELDPAFLELWDHADDGRQQILEVFGTENLGVLWLFEMAWARLYGIVTLEVFGHIDPVLISSGAIFRAMLLEIGTSLGLADEWDRLRGIAGYPA